MIEGDGDPQTSIYLSLRCVQLGFSSMISRVLHRCMNGRMQVTGGAGCAQSEMQSNHLRERRANEGENLASTFSFVCMW